MLHILETLADERVEARVAGVYKAWITSVADRRFLVLEPKAMVSEDMGFGLGGWFVFRIVLKGNRMELAMVAGDVDGLSGVKTRGEAEQIIARHVANPELYDETASIYRIPRTHYDEVGQLVQRAGLVW